MKKWFYLFVSLALVSAPAFAQHQQTGEIDLEQDTAKTDVYPVTQDHTIAYFKALQDTVEKAASGIVPATQPLLNANELTFLGAVYLQCTVSNGTCRDILNALLEIDVINSRLSKKAQCPTLKQFWKSWVKNEFEQRQKYMVQTGYLRVTEEFKRNDRPKYIKCEETVQAAMAGGGPDGEFFKSRYARDSEPVKAVQATNKILDEIKSHFANIFNVIASNR